GFFEDAKQYLDALKSAGLEYKVVFLEASDEVLIRRYNETRRTHPLAMSDGSNIEGIRKEREQLEEIQKISDYVIDTSNMKPARLRQEITEIFMSGQQEETFTINLKSFGYKHGIPLDADIVFDMRFIPNPFYVPSLKKLTGNSRKVRNYVMKHSEAKVFVERVDVMVNDLIPCYIREGKYNLNIAFGCTGGQHRSVTLANEFAEIFEAQGKRITIEHRDL
ncbi:MAG: RNase adapter RapZ, partial [Anaerovorax sp.]